MTPARAPAGDPLGGQTLAELLEALAARTSAPSGGAAAGVALALAGALCAMAARFSGRQLSSAEEVAARADGLRARALNLAAEDARAYGALLAARRLPAGAGREEEVATALAHAVGVPLEMAEVGAEISLLATSVASSGNPNLMGDALVAVLLADAAAAAASTLAEINRAGGG